MDDLQFVINDIKSFIEDSVRPNASVLRFWLEKLRAVASEMKEDPNVPNDQ